MRTVWILPIVKVKNFMNNVTNLEKNNNIMVIAKGYTISTIITCILLLIYAIILVNTHLIRGE